MSDLIIGSYNSFSDVGSSVNKVERKIINVESKKTTITGHSDDIISVTGEIDEEFDLYDSECCKIGFSDGTLLNIKYDDYGLWRITVIFKGKLFESKYEGSVDNDINDKVLFHSGLKWVICDKL